MANVFNEAKKLLLDATLDMDGDVLRIMLFTTSPASLTTAMKNHVDVADVLADSGNFVEAADATYTGQGASGRLTLTTTPATKDDTADQAEIDATDVTWIALDNDLLTGAMIFKFVTSDALSTPIGFYDFASNLQTNTGDVTVEFSATEGFFTLGG
jgi:hypothetical protein